MMKAEHAVDRGEVIEVDARYIGKVAASSSIQIISTSTRSGQPGLGFVGWD